MSDSIDDTINAPGTGFSTTPPALPGAVGRKAGELDAFKNAGGPGAPVAGRGSPSGGKKGGAKKKEGRPANNGAGFSKTAIDEEVVDPEIEAARAEFESVLVELLVSTTDNIADARFILLKKRFPEAEARGLADKARLTDKEKKFFGGLAVRLWRKYLGDKYLFTDEAIAAVYALQYILRNIEPIKAAKKIEAEINGKSADQQSRLPVAPGANNGSIGHRENRIGNPDDLHSSGPARTDL